VQTQPYHKRKVRNEHQLTTRSTNSHRPTSNTLTVDALAFRVFLEEPPWWRQQANQLDDVFSHHRFLPLVGFEVFFLLGAHQSAEEDVARLWIERTI
jgi:hypothetical protein